MTITIKSRLCAVRSCRKKFTPNKPMQRVCSLACATQLAKENAEKRDALSAKRARAEIRRRKEAIKTIPELIAEAQIAFNAYIRLRDEGRPCICCGRFPSSSSAGGDWDAGHYRSRGAAPHLRFDERNCHRQLKQCNRYASGNVVGYRTGLIQRIGLTEVESLEANNQTHKWSREELVGIRDMYRRRVRQMKNGESLLAMLPVALP
jgi:hypothetical protein